MVRADTKLLQSCEKLWSLMRDINTDKDTCTGIVPMSRPVSTTIACSKFITQKRFAVRAECQPIVKREHQRNVTNENFK